MQNEQDLEKLVHAHTAALLRYCTGLLGCEADAQDAVQKTFIKAWQQRHTLRHDGTDNERAWLYRIAYRTSLDMLRAIKRAAAYPTPEPLEQDPGISEELRAALNTLAPLDRALILERVLDGLDYAALACIHGRPAAYLRTRYHRAKKQLAQRLKVSATHTMPTQTQVNAMPLRPFLKTAVVRGAASGCVRPAPARATSAVYVLPHGIRTIWRGR